MLIEFQVMMKCNAETKRLVRAANATESAELFVQGFDTIITIVIHYTLNCDESLS